jgi:hypothetical protein
MPEPTEIRLPGIRDLKVGFQSKGKAPKLCTTITFEVDTPDDIYLLLRMQKRKIPMNIVIVGIQAEFSE